ncbi:glycosyl hydrolase [Oceanispirochaeta sp. M2]|nr:glycosyl hydrolase [Oceanispirochaeta sp. M2]NPD73999.1 glycosyl hydrolase [Oceanispirochaeta sp. M1]RDG30173.1 glycosyl hydrolase [Oceanispirochaeta sp. M1]
MSSRGNRLMSLAGRDFSKSTNRDLELQLNKVINERMHGLCFSPYLEHQGPGDQISEKQIREKIELIKPYTKWIRIFSCSDGNEAIAEIAHENGLKTMVGAWIGKDFAKNEMEIENLISIAQKGFVDIAAVGNEVMLREEQSEEAMLDYINRVKKEIPEIPVGYVDAYYEFCDRPSITDACDVILANCYPFWEGCSLEHSLPYMKDMYHRAKTAAKGKKVIISETGWPNIGTKFHGAVPSRENAMKYFINSFKWAEEEDIEIFYFSAFDEAWKIEDEGDVGAYWGLWDKSGSMKYPVESIIKSV